MSDASKSTEEVQAVRRENAVTLEKGPGYTGPETVRDKPSRSVAEAARRRHGQLQSDRQARG